MRSNQELIRRLSCVDEVLVLDDRNIFIMLITTLRTVAELIRRRADLYFDLELYSAFASLLALCAVTRNRLGFYRHSVAFKNGIYTHLMYFNTRMPVRLLYLRLGRVRLQPSSCSRRLQETNFTMKWHNQGDAATSSRSRFQYPGVTCPRQ
jgi:hypothetical protein